MIPAPVRPPRRPVAPPRLTAALATLAALGSVLAGPTGASGAATTQRWSSDCRSAGEASRGAVRITQANLLSGQPFEDFQADVSAVISGRPDFVTYNEVPFRKDGILAPDGYDLWRSPNTDPKLGEYLAASPVAWRTDRWQPIGQGTTNITNRWGKTPSQTVHLGVRYANWVTLRNIADGRVLSVVAVHFAPKSTYTTDLLAPSIRALGSLTNRLAETGPVLVGGDLNVGFGGSLYNDVALPLLSEYGLTPTFKVGGMPVGGTGDHHGATIDYVLMRDASSFSVHAHCKYELNSDHDGLTADLVPMWSPADQPPVFLRSTLVNDPQGSFSARRSVLDLMVRAIDHAPSGAGIHLDTDALADRRVFESLIKAKRRGVYIQFLTRRDRPTEYEAILFRRLGAKIRTRQWAVECPWQCRRIEGRTELPPTRLLVSRTGLSRAVVILADQPLTRAATTNPARAQIHVDKAVYDGAFDRFLRLVGRRL